EYSPIRPLVDWLDYNGYTLVTKTAREYTDSQGRKRWRGDMDIEIAVDMLDLADKADHIVLFSGDGDFRRLVEAVQRKGVRVTVVSTVKSQPPMASDDLRRQADAFVDLQDLADIIAALPRLKVIVTLGDVSRRNVLKALGLRASAGSPGHGSECDAGPYRLINSYHCSRLNTNTGRLTAPMFEAVFERARALL